MKPLYNYTSRSNIIGLIRDANPGLDLRAAEVNLGELTTDPETNVTTLKVHATLDQGYNGSVDITYTRLVATDYLPLLREGFLHVAKPSSLIDLNIRIAYALNGVFEDTSVAVYPELLSDTSNNIVVVDYTFNEGWVYSNTDTIKFYVTSIPLNESPGFRVSNNKVRVSTSGNARGIPVPATFGLFVGGSNGAAALGIITSISNLGVLLNEETTLESDTRYSAAGVGLDANLGMFYGGIHNGSFTTRCTRLNGLGVRISADTGAGTHTRSSSSAKFNPNKALFYGGDMNKLSAQAVMIAANGGVWKNEPTLGTARTTLSGAGYTPTVSVHNGGSAELEGSVKASNITTRINDQATLLSPETNVGVTRITAAATGFNENLAIWYGGSTDTQYLNRTTRINAAGGIIAKDWILGNTRQHISGAKVNDKIGVFYGGRSSTLRNTVTRVVWTGELAATETYVGTPRLSVTGAGYV